MVSTVKKDDTKGENMMLFFVPRNEERAAPFRERLFRFCRIKFYCMVFTGSKGHSKKSGGPSGGGAGEPGVMFKYPML